MRPALRTTPFLLGLLVAGSALVRAGLAWLQATPLYFPDEYLYSELGRSLAEEGLPLVRGEYPSFLPLLTPLVTAPAWLVSDVGTAYRIAQAEGALAMSLAAVPAFLLARRLGVARGRSFLLAAITLLVPDLVYTSFLMSEPFAFPLFLGAILTGVGVIAEPSRRGQLVFLLVLAALLCTRIQFAVVPLAFAIAVVVLGARERKLGAAMRTQALPLTLFATGGAAALAVGLGLGLGSYGGLLDLELSPAVLARWSGINLIVVFLAAGWVIVPGALLGLHAGLARPRSRAEAAFAVLVVVLTPLLLVEGAVFGGGFSQVMERYAFYAAPLLAVAFALAASRGLLRSRAHVAGCLVLFVLGLFAPKVDDLFFASTDHAPSLFLYRLLDGEIGWSAPLVVGGAMAALALLGLLLGARGRHGHVIASGALVCLVTSVAAAAFMHSTAERVAGNLPASRSFVDAASVPGTAFLAFSATDWKHQLETLFWNRDIERVLRLPGAVTDRWASEPVSISADGALLVRGRPVRSPLAVDAGSAIVELRGSEVVERGPKLVLWRPTGRVRLAFLFDGVYPRTRWLGARGTISAWPETRGRELRGEVVLHLVADRGSKPSLIHFESSNGFRRDVRIGDARPTRVVLPVSGRGEWSSAFSSDRLRFRVDGQVASVRFVGLHVSIESRRDPPGSRPTLLS